MSSAADGYDIDDSDIEDEDDVGPVSSDELLKAPRGSEEDATEENSGDENLKEDPQGIPALNSREQRLLALRARMAQANKQNRQLVADKASRTEQLIETKKKRKKTEKDEEGVSLDKTIKENMDEARKKRKKARKANYSIDQEDVEYVNYKRDSEAVPYTREEYAQKLKDHDMDVLEVAFSGGADDEIPPGNVELMREELVKRKARRRSFHRRRREDVNSINYVDENNRSFNLAIERAYGKYTKRIVENLDRGTSI